MDAPLKVERNGEWKAVSFISSKKTILMRCMREKGCVPCGEAQLVLRPLPLHLPKLEGLCILPCDHSKPACVAEARIEEAAACRG
jgi:hypothetical protein